MTYDVTVCIPTFPGREAMLHRAVRSVSAQTWSPRAIEIASDTEREGAAVTRDRAWRAARTDWVAFLDDDDELLPRHLELLVACAKLTDADLVFPWFTVVGGADPFPQHFGMPWDDAVPRQTTITFLIRREWLERVGGFDDPDPTLDAAPDGNRAGEDYRLILRLVEQGAKIVHLPEKTWIWYHHNGNTSGMPSRRPST